MEQQSSEYFSDLLHRISRSDKRAFDELFRSLYPTMVLFACRYVHDKSTASDVVQDSFIKIWQKRNSLKDINYVKSYIYRTVRNLSLNYLRDTANTETGLETETLNVHYLKNQQHATESPDESDHDQKMQNLLSWIQKLPDRQREAFELSRFEGLDHQEIAEVMQVSARTVNNHIVDALKNLQSMRDMHSKKKRSTL